MGTPYTNGYFTGGRIIDILQNEEKRNAYDELNLFQGQRRRSKPVSQSRARDIKDTDRRLVLFEFWKNKTSTWVERAKIWAGVPSTNKR